MAFTRDINDAFIEYLNERGFLPILQPTGGLEPTTIYLVDPQSARCMLHGSLNNMLPAGLTLEAEPRPSSALENAAASKADANVSISFFEKLMKMFGASGGAKLDASAKAQDDTKFTFANVKSLLVEPAAIEQALNTLSPGDKTPIGDAVRARFTAAEFDQGFVHIAYEYLYSNKIEMRAGGSIAGELGIEGTVTQEASVKLGLGAGKQSGAATLYGGKEPVAFAFRLAQIQHDKHRYYVRAKLAEGAGLSATDAAADPYLVETGRIFEIES